LRSFPKKIRLVRRQDIHDFRKLVLGIRTVSQLVEIGGEGSDVGFLDTTRQPFFDEVPRILVEMETTTTPYEIGEKTKLCVGQFQFRATVRHAGTLTARAC
jgi:hypothetical protein